MLAAPLLVLGVASLGKYLSNSFRTRESNYLRQEISPSELPSGTDIYESNRFNQVDKEVRQLSAKSYQDSMHPCDTNVIPPFYNALYPDKCANLRDSMLPMVINDVDPNSLNYKILQGPMWKSTVKLPSETILEHLNPLTGLPFENTHNNMVPYFGSSVRQNTDEGVHKQTLEAFTGTGEIASRHRAEIPSLFAPVQQNIYGSQNVPEEFRLQRYLPSNLKTNVLPAPQIRTCAPKPEELARPVYRNIDDLRVNKQQTHNLPIAAPPQSISAIPQIGLVKKNNPPKYHIIGAERFAPASSFVHSDRIREIPTSSNFGKDTSGEQYFGPSNGYLFAMKPRISVANNSM